jgi:hypothetical protein
MSVGSKSQFAAEVLSNDFPKQTKRLSLTPAIGAFADAEAIDHGQLSNLLGAEVPQSWPPKNVPPPGLDGASGWQNCYLTHAGPDNRPVAVGFAGIKKWHPEHKTIQIGVALVPEYQGQRLGEEIVTKASIVYMMSRAFLAVHSLCAASRRDFTPHKLKLRNYPNLIREAVVRLKNEKFSKKISEEPLGSSNQTRLGLRCSTKRGSSPSLRFWQDFKACFARTDCSENCSEYL